MESEGKDTIVTGGICIWSGQPLQILWAGQTQIGRVCDFLVIEHCLKLKRAKLQLPTTTRIASRNFIHQNSLM
eukprot:6194132-Pleurochrysis_carterae.AAC.3